MLTYLCILLSKCRSYEMGFEFMPRAFLLLRVEMWVNEVYILYIIIYLFINYISFTFSLYLSVSFISLSLFLYVDLMIMRLELEFMPRAHLLWRVEIWVNKGYILSLSLSLCLWNIHSPYLSLSVPLLYLFHNIS